MFVRVFSKILDGVAENVLDGLYFLLPLKRE